MYLGLESGWLFRPRICQSGGLSSPATKFLRCSPCPPLRVHFDTSIGTRDVRFWLCFLVAGKFQRRLSIPFIDQRKYYTLTARLTLAAAATVQTKTREACVNQNLLFRVMSGKTAAIPLVVLELVRTRLNRAVHHQQRVNFLLPRCDLSPGKNSHVTGYHRQW
jgi:hypothetical protein